LEDWTDNQLKIDCWLGGDVVGIDPKQQWTECIVTSWHPTYLHWDGEMETGSSERSFRLSLR